MARAIRRGVAERAGDDGVRAAGLEALDDVSPARRVHDDRPARRVVAHADSCIDLRSALVAHLPDGIQCEPATAAIVRNDGVVFEMPAEVPGC